VHIPLEFCHAPLILALCTVQQYFEICILFLELLNLFNGWSLCKLTLQLSNLGLELQQNQGTILNAQSPRIDLVVFSVFLEQLAPQGVLWAVLVLLENAEVVCAEHGRRFRVVSDALCPSHAGRRGRRFSAMQEVVLTVQQPRRDRACTMWS
jgi:hypothetical protein